MTSQKQLGSTGRNDRANAKTNYSVPLDVSPFGRPATVTSSPPL